DEIRRAILSLPKHKAPGPDRLSNYYYHKLETLLTPHLTKLFNTIKMSGTLPTEMLEAHVVTLPKPGKPPTQCENLRPISLLNADIKLYAKLWALRLKTHLTELVSIKQAGYVPGRQ
ncbi:Hypothetical predicted protein, partial [Pelobates cultripes]